MVPHWYVRRGDVEVIAYAVRHDQRSDVIACLADAGFLFDPPRTVTRSLLDTFDGRLHAAGMRLEVVASNGLTLVLSGAGTVAAHLEVSAPPRFAPDLSSGPLRARLAAVIDGRALMSRVRMTTRSTAGVSRDRLGKTVAAAVLYEQLRVDGYGVVEHPSATIEIHDVTGYGKHGRAAVAQLEGLGLQRLDTDTLAMAAGAAGIDLAGWSGSPAVPLDAAMPAVDGFRRVLANLAEAIDVNWQGTIDEIDTEFLHDLRVAVRRTRSVLSEGKQVLPPAVIERSGRRLAWFGALTGPARDLDVYLIGWSDYTAGLDAPVVAALAPVRAVLAQRCRSAHSDLAQFMRSAEAAEHMTAWRAWLDQPDARLDPGAAADHPLGELIGAHIRKSHTRLVERGRRINTSSPAEQVHDLRKDAKKLRYLLECFASLLAEKPTKAFVRGLKVLQDNLGEHQDNEVHADELRNIAARLPHNGVPPDTMMAIGQLVERFDQRRTAARAEFAERFAEFDSKANRRALKSALEAMGQ